MTGPTIQLPNGVHHVTVDAHCESWEAWDRITTEREWSTRAWWVNHEGECDRDAPWARLHVQGERTMDGVRIVVHPPPPQMTRKSMA